MLSRVAERIYWMARSLERAEYLARLIEVHSALLLDMPDESEINWFTLIKTFDAEANFDRLYEQTNEINIMRFLISDQHNPSSLINTIANIRENARTSLDILPEEIWEQINQAYLLTKKSTESVPNRHKRQALLKKILIHCFCIRGILQSNLSRTYAYYFYQVGRSIEQTDMTSRILEMTSLLLSETRSESVRKHEGLLWTNLLQALSAHQMFLQAQRSEATAINVLDFLILDRHFPGSLYCSLDCLSVNLVGLPKRSNVMIETTRLTKTLERINPEVIPADDMYAVMNTIQEELALLHASIQATWFHPE